MGGARSLSGRVGEENNLLLLLEFEPLTFWRRESAPQAIAVEFTVQETEQTAIWGGGRGSLMYSSRSNVNINWMLDGKNTVFRQLWFCRQFRLKQPSGLHSLPGGSDVLASFAPGASNYNCTI